MKRTPAAPPPGLSGGIDLIVKFSGLPAPFARGMNSATMHPFASRELPTPELRRAADVVAGFLAETDGVDAADLVVLAGNSVLACVDHAVRIATAAGCPLLMSGGVGHATAHLRTAIADAPVLDGLAIRGDTEAALLGAIAVERYGFPADRLILEDRSTNTGENAAFTRAIVAARSKPPRHVVLVQDPLMQRRTKATFVHEFRGSETRFFASPPFQPRIDGPDTTKAWPVDRFLTVLLGEIVRLNNDENGYGPRGRGFFGVVDIPADVLAADARLRAHLPQYIGR